MSKSTDLVQGALDLLVLAGASPNASARCPPTCSRSARERFIHVYTSSNRTAAEWAVSENNRRANFYSLTRAGRGMLAQESAQWEKLAAAISTIVRAV